MKNALFVIIILMIGLTSVSAQNIAQLEQELNQLTAEFSAGKISAQQYQQRAVEITQKMQAAVLGTQQQLDQSSQSYSFSDTEVRRLTSLLDQSKRLSAQLNEGRISEAEAQRQSDAVQREYDSIYAPYVNLQRENLQNIAQQQKEIDDEIARLWPGAILGWPADSVFTDRTWPVLRQPSGTWASYSIDVFEGADAKPVRDKIILYLNNASETDYQNLKRQIESGNGATFNENNGHTMYVLFETESNGLHRYYGHYISFRDGVIRYERDSTAYDDGRGTRRRD
jgi:hypothetical protein